MTTKDACRVTRDEPELFPLQATEAPFLITASELQHRKAVRRQTRRLSTRSEAVRRLVDLGLKAKGK